MCENMDTSCMFFFHVSYTRPVRKVFSHFEYLENPSRGLDVTWQADRGDLRTRQQSLSCRASQSVVRCRWMSLCTVWTSHSQWPSEQISESASMRLPILQLSCSLSLDRTSHHPDLSTHLQPRFSCLRLLGYPKAKIAFEIEGICECDGHTVHKLSQRRLTADWLALQESDCSRMNSKVSSDCLPSYIKVTLPVLEIFRMAGYFPDSPRIVYYIICHIHQSIYLSIYLIIHHSVRFSG